DAGQAASPCSPCHRFHPLLGLASFLQPCLVESPSSRANKRDGAASRDAIPKGSTSRAARRRCHSRTVCQTVLAIPASATGSDREIVFQFLGATPISPPNALVIIPGGL